MKITLQEKYWLFFVSLLVCVSCGPWEKADEFVDGLSCGMQMDEIREYVAQYPATTVEEQNFEGYPPVVARHGDTMIGLWLREGQLEAAQVFWLDGKPTSVSKRPRVELCSEADDESIE